MNSEDIREAFDFLADHRSERFENGLGHGSIEVRHIECTGDLPEEGPDLVGSVMERSRSLRQCEITVGTPGKNGRPQKYTTSSDDPRLKDRPVSFC